MDEKRTTRVDAYFSADVETDGPIPGRFSMLSFALVYAGSFDGHSFIKPSSYDHIFYRELRPISDKFEQEALNINQLNRDRLKYEGACPETVMDEAYSWVMTVSGSQSPVLAAFPVSFDWTWLYWYFIAFSEHGSPFGYSRCFDIKTAFAVKSRTPLSLSGRSKLPRSFMSDRKHTHFAIDDAIEQAEIFAKLMEY